MFSRENSGQIITKYHVHVARKTKVRIVLCSLADCVASSPDVTGRCHDINHWFAWSTIHLPPWNDCNISTHGPCGVNMIEILLNIILSIISMSIISNTHINFLICRSVFTSTTCNDTLVYCNEHFKITTKNSLYDSRAIVQL